MHHIYKRTTIVCGFSPVNLFHVFITHFPNIFLFITPLEDCFCKTVISRSIKTVFPRSFKKVQGVHNGDQSLRSSHSRVFYKSGVIKNFAKIVLKHLCGSLHLINLQSKGTD